MTIIEFLEARISEDELAATEGISGQADPESGWGYMDHALTPHVGIIHEAVQAEHIIRWHPARVLAECAAKRAIISRHKPDRILENWYWSRRRCAECGKEWHKWLNNDVPTDIGPEQGCPTLRALASIYADHPDYQDDWKV